MVWGAYAMKIEVQMAFAQVGNKVPQSARLSEGGGGGQFGQCPNRPGIFRSGASLSAWISMIRKKI